MSNKTKNNNLFYLKKNNINKDNIIPLNCPNCSIVLNTYDIDSFKNYKCCSWCKLQWAENTTYNWQNGWRPNKDTIKKELKKRNFKK